MITAIVIVLSLAVLWILARPFLGFRGFLKRLKRTTWTTRKFEGFDYMFMQNEVLRWPRGPAYVRSGDLWDVVYRAATTSTHYFSGQPSSGEPQLPSCFTVYFPEKGEAKWVGLIEELPQAVLDAIPHVKFVLAKSPHDDKPFYRAA